MKAEVVHYIASEAVRRYGSIEPRLPEKLQRNIRRNFQVTVPRETILGLAERYKAIYEYGSSILGAYLLPPKGRYADHTDVRMTEFFTALTKRFPKESRRVIEMVVYYVVHYEYLR